MKSRIEFLVSDLCAEIDDLRADLAEARAEAKQWREKFHDQTISDIRHGETMMAGLLEIAIRGVGPKP